MKIVTYTTVLLLISILGSCSSDKGETYESIPKTNEQSSEISDYIGLYVSDAESLAIQRGEKFIRDEIDGEQAYAFADYEVGRIRATIKNGIVVSYFIEGQNINSEEQENTSQLIETQEETRPEVILTGDFSGDTSGTVEIVRDGDENIIVLSGFSTGSAPDLRVYVSENDINSKSDISSALEINKLKKRTGDQTYILPSNIDADNIISVAIHCKSFNKLYGTAKVQ